MLVPLHMKLLRRVSGHKAGGGALLLVTHEVVIDSVQVYLVLRLSQHFALPFPNWFDTFQTAYFSYISQELFDSRISPHMCFLMYIDACCL